MARNGYYRNPLQLGRKSIGYMSYYDDDEREKTISIEQFGEHF
jgi:hypothetical protein